MTLAELREAHEGFFPDLMGADAKGVLPPVKGVPEHFLQVEQQLATRFEAMDRMGITWEHIQAINPRMIVASVKGFGPGPYEDCKVYENVAQCAGGSASTTGFQPSTCASFQSPGALGQPSPSRLIPVASLMISPAPARCP